MDDSVGRHGEGGVALLAVLFILLVIGGSSASFVWFMNQQQSRAGAHLRSAAALAVAEAGVHRGLAILESVAPDGKTLGRHWRSAAHSEALRVGSLEGRFTLALTDEADGAIIITSAGEVAGLTRRLRARVYLASPALLAALHGRGVISLDRHPATIAILPYGTGTQGRSWVHIAASRGIEFTSTDVSLNTPSVDFEAAPGPLDASEKADGAVRIRASNPARILLARGAALTLGQERRRVDIQQLRAVGIQVEGTALDTETLADLPDVDRAYYQGLAARNTDNAALNRAAGKYSGDGDLVRKRHSLYTSMEFEQLTNYLRAESLPGLLRGVIYIKDGGASLLDGQRMQIMEGALVTESTVEVAEGASLEITHSAATRTLPGLLVLDSGALVVTQGARLRLHGLVYASKTIDAGRDARVDAVGAVLGNDPEYSFRTYGASVVIRYDPAVLGTPGLRMPTPGPVVAWVAAWKELP